MKKFFLFAAAAIAAMTVNAVSYNFAGITADQIVVDAQGAKSTYTMDAGKETEQIIPSVNYISTNGTVMNVSINGLNDFAMTYKNGSDTKDGHKDNILKFAEDYMQADGKNVIMIFKNCTMMDVVTLVVAAKGDTNAEFEATDAIADPDNATSIAKAATLADYTTLKFYPNGDVDVAIKETKGGFRIISATVTPLQGIENTGAAVKAEKFFRNGQLIIRKNGVEYNALGAQL